jgi:hypothetical protein
MRRFLVQLSESEASNHTPSLVDFTITTLELKFSVHTTHTMSEWRDISTAPRDGVFVLLHNDNWASDVEGFWHKGSQSWSANTRIPGIENRVISAEPPTHWKPLTVEEEKY